MPSIRTSLALRAKASTLAQTLILLTMVAISSGAFAQDSFMERFMPMPLESFQIARGDVNNDGIPDIIVCNATGGSSASAVTVFLGNGDGTFQAPINSGAGTGAWDLVVGDFNGDGILDAAVAGYISDSQGVLQILLGNGDGTFRNGQTIDLPNFSMTLATGDFNGDGKLDIAVANNIVSFYEGAGDGTFTLNSTMQVGTQPMLQQVKVGDFNGDGKTDLAVNDGFNVFVLFNTGPFTFTTTQVASYIEMLNITAVDVNQDHYTDLITTYYSCIQNNSPSCATWQVLLGVKGQQTMKTGFSMPYSPAVFPYGPTTAADVNGDGFNDVVALSTQFTVSVWMGNPDGSFQTTPVQYRSGSDLTFTGIIASDFNRDGKIDFAVPNSGNNTLSILLNATPQATTCTAGTVTLLITECMPVDHTYSNSPLHVNALSTDTAHKVTAMQGYVNNSLIVSQATNSLNFSTTEPDGDYLVVTKAWDSSGANFRTDRHVHIYTGTPGETCATKLNALNICSPTQNQTTTTTLHVLANSQSLNIVTAIQVYIDNALAYNDTSGTSYVDTTFNISTGSHYIVVKTFDMSGKVLSASRTIKAQ
jgi:hypothetical protein